jgi:hypothetical protein
MRTTAIRNDFSDFMFAPFRYRPAGLLEAGERVGWGLAGDEVPPWVTAEAAVEPVRAPFGERAVTALAEKVDLAATVDPLLFCWMDVACASLRELAVPKLAASLPAGVFLVPVAGQPVLVSSWPFALLGPAGSQQDPARAAQQ